MFLLKLSKYIPFCTFIFLFHGIGSTWALQHKGPPQRQTVKKQIYSFYFCPDFQWVRRSTVPTCAASFKNKKGELICFSRIQFLNILHSEKKSFCGNYRVEEKYFTPLELRPGKGKQKIKRYYVHSILQNEKISFFEKLKKKTENFRDSWSTLLASVDVLGVGRGLFFYEKTTQSTPEDMIKWLGFVHLYTETGIHLFLIFHTVEKSLFYLGSFFFPTTASLWWGVRLIAWLWILFSWILTGCRLGLLRPLVIHLLKRNAHTFGYQWKLYSPLFLSLLWDGLSFLYHGLIHQNWMYAPGRLYYGLAVGGGLFFWEWAQGVTKQWHPKNKLKSCFEHFSLSVGSWVGPAWMELIEWRWVAMSTPLLNMLSVPVVCVLFYPCAFILLSLSVVCPSYMHGMLFYFLKILTVIMNEWIFFLIQLMFRLKLYFTISVQEKELLVSFLFSGVFVVFLSLKVWRIKKLWATSIYAFMGGWCLYLFHATPSRQKASSFQAHTIVQLDVGQGDSALIFYENGKVGMIDTGSFRHGSLLYWSKVFAYYSILQLDFVVISHLDEDHSGGLFHLLKWIPVKNIYVSKLEFKSKKGEDFQLKLQETQTQWKEIGKSDPRLFHFLEAIPSTKRNEQMLSVLIPLESHKYFLSAGDSHARHEPRLLKWLYSNDFKKAPTIQLFKVSHHGSRYSNSVSFLKKIQPHTSWISSGFGNPYGHPHLALLTRFQELKLKVFRTDLRGSLIYSVKN